MADTPYPLTRQTREHAMINGNGGATYGPFAFKIFDTADVEVLTKAAGATKFSIALVTVTKVSGLALDNFTIAFPANVPATTKIKVTGKRLPERSAGIAKGTRLDMDALEKELSKIAAAQQELRRDVIPMDPEIDNGSTLMLSDGRVIKGPNVSEILAALTYANAAYNSASAAATSASQAAASAAAAALFNPASYYLKTEIDAGFYTKAAVDGAKVDKSGSTLTGFLVLHADPSANMNPATKQYVDGKTVLASQAEAEAGTENTKLTTSLRVKQAVVINRQAYIHVRDQKASGTDGGTSSVGINVRALNTVVHNGITGASLASNKVTLPAGTYAVQARVPAYGANRHHAWLRTDTGTILAIGGGQYASSASGVSNDSVVQGKFTLAAQANLEVAHYFSSGLAANGLGTAGSSGSIAEVYTDMIIARLD